MAGCKNKERVSKVPTIDAEAELSKRDISHLLVTYK